MRRIRRQRRWFLPALSAVLIAALGAMLNVATNHTDSWVAWIVVAVLVVASAVAAVLLDRRGTEQQSPGGTKIVSSSSQSRFSETYGLVARAQETVGADGSKTTTIEWFSEEMAARFFREDFGSGKE